MKIMVSMKRVPDPDNVNKIKVLSDKSDVSVEGLEFKPNPFDELAVEAALRLTENKVTKERFGEVIVVSIGPDEVSHQIRTCLAMGAQRGILVQGNDRELDSNLVAEVFERLYQLENPDLILMGKQATDGDSNQVGQILAKKLGVAQATFASQICLEIEKKVARVKREVDGGLAEVEIKLPAVITVDLRIGNPKAVQNGITPKDEAYPEGPRYASLKGIMQARKKEIKKIKMEDLGIEPRLKVKTIRYEVPPSRKAGIIVSSVQELVEKLKKEAKVI